MARILIVDDDQDTADTLAAIYRLNGHESCACYSGDECLAAADSFNPDLVVIDLWMPKMNGIDVARKLKGRFPMIALTGSAADLGEDADLFLFRILKPPAMQDLLKVVEMLENRTRV